MSRSTETLTIDEGMILSSSHEIVQSVINDEFKFDKLIVKGTANAFDKNFIGSAIFETFRKKLGESIVSLELHEPFDLDLNFTNLRCLSIKNPDIFQFILPKLHKRNVALEELSIHDKVIECTTNGDKKKINVTFIEILQLFKSLKSLTFQCSILLETNIIMKLFSELNTIIWGTDGLFVDCEPLPQWTDYTNYYWIIEMVKIEIVKVENARKLVIRPLFLREKMIEVEGMKLQCETNCNLNHRTFKSESVEKFTFENQQKCFNYFVSCFESFPRLVEISNLYLDDIFVLSLISTTLNHLTTLSLHYRGPPPPAWPSFPNMEKVVVNFLMSTYESFEKFIKSFPNLKKLRVNVESGNTDDDCAIIITENLKKLEYLSIQFDESKLTSIGLDLIGYKLKELQHLYINYSERFSDIEKLFDDLPKLEVLWYGHSFLLRRSMKRTDIPAVLLTKAKIIEDLPPELLEQIFVHLNINEQRYCRQVSKFWFNIHASSPHFDRSLNLRNSYLSWATKPVKIFVNTDFKYNWIIFDETSFAKDEDLTRFWEKIGANVEEICIKDRSLNVMDAVKTGWKASHFPKLKRLTIEVLPLFYDLLHQDISEWKLLLNRIECLSVNYLFPRVLTKNVEYSMSNVTQLIVDGCMNETILAFFTRISFPKINTLIILHVSYETIDLTQIFDTKLKFGQLKTLFIGKYYQWNEEDFNLILKSCPKVECLGIGFITKYKDFSNILNYEAVAKKMFDNMSSLNGLYFVIFENTQEKRYKTFLRTGVSFTESKKLCRIFDKINSSLEN